MSKMGRWTWSILSGEAVLGGSGNGGGIWFVARASCESPFPLDVYPKPSHHRRCYVGTRTLTRAKFSPSLVIKPNTLHVRITLYVRQELVYLMCTLISPGLGDKVCTSSLLSECVIDVFVKSDRSCSSPCISCLTIERISCSDGRTCSSSPELEIKSALFSES